MFANLRALFVRTANSTYLFDDDNYVIRLGAEDNASGMEVGLAYHVLSRPRFITNLGEVVDPFAACVDYNDVVARLEFSYETSRYDEVEDKHVASAVPVITSTAERWYFLSASDAWFDHNTFWRESQDVEMMRVYLRNLGPDEFFVANDEVARLDRPLPTVRHFREKYGWTLGRGMNAIKTVCSTAIITKTVQI